MRQHPESPEPPKKSTVEIALAQAIYEIRLLLADCLGSENEAPMNIRQAAHLAYAFHNIALNTIQGEDADVSTVRPALEAMDKMLGSNFVNILDGSN